MWSIHAPCVVREQDIHEGVEGVDEGVVDVNEGVSMCIVYVMCCGV